MGNLKIKIAAKTSIVCIAPILESVIRADDTLLFDLTWNYDGVDYSVEDPSTTISIYISNDNIDYEVLPFSFPYNVTDRTIDLSSKAWEVFYFKIRLVNESCDLYSNVINVNL